jgi:hypothetical protein
VYLKKFEKPRPGSCYNNLQIRHTLVPAPRGTFTSPVFPPIAVILLLPPLLFFFVFTKWRLVRCVEDDIFI